jgi:hypothetical protein
MCNFITYIDVSIKNLLHNFILVFAPTCFGLEPRPTSGSYEPLDVDNSYQNVFKIVIKIQQAVSKHLYIKHHLQID